MPQVDYENEYYEDYKPDYLKHLLEDLEWLHQIWGDWVEAVEELIPSPQETGSWMDVGCGYGFFGDFVSQRPANWHVCGYDPSVSATEYCRRHFSLEYKKWWQHQEHFSVISAIHVLEHVEQASQFLADVRNALVPGGLFLCVVPNDNSTIQEQLVSKRGFRRWWIHPTHVNYYTPKRLEVDLSTAGLQPQYRTTDFQMEMFLAMGLDYTNDTELGRKCHGFRKQFDLLLGNRRRAYYEHLAQAGLGRDIVVVAQKK